MKWTVTYMEHSVLLLAGMVRTEKSTMIGAGLASVWFRSEEGDSFVGIYLFVPDTEETFAGGLTISATISFGRLKADFSNEVSPEYIANSYEGTFLNKGVSASFGSVHMFQMREGIGEEENLEWHLERGLSWERLDMSISS